MNVAILSLCYAIVVHQALAGSITVGDVSLYAGTILQFSVTAHWLRVNIIMGYEHGLYLRRFFGFLKREPLVHVEPPDRALRVPGFLQRGIELRQVFFRYPGTSRLVLRGLSLTIAPGETVALVGENGSGKTTLVKLLMRLYDVTDGEILLEGEDIRRYDLEDLRSNMTGLFQDFSRYHMTARDNIALGCIEEREDLPAIQQAARKGRADVLIEKLPNGYGTMLGRHFQGGVDLSGGEWQRIALSRAFLREAQILILDEPSAALDVETEHEMFQRSTKLMHGRTTLLVSHRFTTVRMAHRIAVLNEGAIVEQGSHKALMAEDRHYARMFRMQAERYWA